MLGLVSVVAIVEQILRIIALSMELAMKQIAQMPPENQAAFWERHEKRMARLDDAFEFWQGLTEKLSKKESTP